MHAGFHPGGVGGKLPPQNLGQLYRKVYKATPISWSFPPKMKGSSSTNDGRHTHGKKRKHEAELDETLMCFFFPIATLRQLPGGTVVYAVPARWGCGLL